MNNLEKYRALKLVSLIIISISFPLTILLATIGLAEPKYNIQKTSTKSGILIYLMIFMIVIYLMKEQWQAYYPILRYLWIVS